MRSRVSKCLLDMQKSFYRAAWTQFFFAKIDGVASAEVTLQLIKSKCLYHSIAVYGLEACPLTNLDLQSLIVINRCLMKLFATKGIETVKYCQEFDFSLPRALRAKRVFISKFK